MDTRRTVSRWLPALILVLVPILSSATIHNITVGNSFFAPLGTQVNPGDTIRWTWVGGFPHSTTADGSSPKFWDSGVSSSAGNTFDLVLTTSDPFGPYPYHCSIHALTMKDTVWLMKYPVNGQPNGSTAPGTDQTNASVAWNDLVAGEAYAVYNDFANPGTFAPVNLWFSFTNAYGTPGSWFDAPKAPDVGFTDQFNPWISSVPTGGYVLSSAQSAGPMWGPGANVISMNFSPGGGAGFGIGIPLMANTPGVTWLDYPVVEIDDDPASPTFGNATFVWTEFIDATVGDADGNGNPFDDAGDRYTLWSSTTDFGGLSGPPFPAFTVPVALTPVLGVLANSPATQRGSVEMVGTVGTPLVGPGAAYAAWYDPTAAIVFIDANAAPGLAGGWGAITGGAGAVPVAPAIALPPVGSPGIQLPMGVTVAVDQTPGGLCAGAVYVAWTDYLAGDADIMFSSSFDGGKTWTPALRVNQDPFGNGLDQWAPHMHVDDSNGEITITYYDRQNDLFNTAIEVWTANSTDCGVTWINCMTSGAGPTPPASVTPFPVALTIGDYLGSDWNKLNGWGAIWNDGRNGLDEDIFHSSVRACDSDADGVIDWLDNCLTTYNPAQTDSDVDGYGAACDCNDTDPNIYPGAPEIPDNLIDEDCNGFDATTCYADNDGDSYGDPGSSVIDLDGSCDPGFVGDNSDCDDTDGGINPGATEIPDDGIDQNCDGFDDITCYADNDSDGFGDPASPLVHTGTCGPGYVTDNTDCDDTDPVIGPCLTCCGAFTAGFTGNADCSADGKRNLADITRLIDRVYISHVPLCCEENGNVDGDPLAKINLADITRLIDHVYISKAQTEPCL